MTTAMATSLEAAKKERHVVSWTPEDDEILREHIAIHGTENWTAISSKFKDKTSRQCRRRWYTYLSTECKKGGWSPEEDMLLCEAQRIFGNRWTEIAKVVSGRTDNAVKNRFTTLRKKRAKFEAISKENSDYIIMMNDKRLFQDEISSLSHASKKFRTNFLNFSENFCLKERSLDGKHSRLPLMVLSQNNNNRDGSQTQHVSRSNAQPAVKDVRFLVPALLNKLQGTFLKRNDPKMRALMQQAELLGSLALKVNMDSSNQNLESVWKELHDFLLRMGDGDLLKFEIAEVDSLLDNFRNMMENFSNNGPEHQPSWSQPDLREESQGSSEYSTEPPCQLTEQNRFEKCSSIKNCVFPVQGERREDFHVVHEDGNRNGVNKTQAVMSSFEPSEQGNEVSSLLTTQYRSPAQTLRPFYCLAEGIPSPKFSESERRFLLRTFGLASPSASKNPIHSQPPPPCRRSLLDSL